MIRKVRVTDLRIGMFVHDFGESWLDHPFWRTRFLISETAELEKLRASGID